MKKACSLFLAFFLAFAMVFSMVRVPALAAGNTEENWDLIDSTMSNYTTVWKAVKGSLGGAVTQKSGYVNISKGDDKTVNPPQGGAYTWLTPAVDVGLPAGVFTAEVTARLAGPVEGKSNEISARIGTDKEDLNGKLYPFFLRYGTQGDISPRSAGADSETLDTTVWHNYGLVVNPAEQTYSVYVDGVKLFSNQPAVTYKGANLFRIGADNDGRCNIDVLAARIGTGDLSGQLGPYKETPAPSVWTEYAFGGDWDADGWRISEKGGSGTMIQFADYVRVSKTDKGIPNYCFLCSPANLTLPADGVTVQVKARLAGPVGEGERNEVSVRYRNSTLSGFYLTYGREGTISRSAGGGAPYQASVDTTQWHVYSMYIRPDNGKVFCDVYVDGVLAWENAPSVIASTAGGDLIRIGADNGGYANINVASVRYAPGFVEPVQSPPEQDAFISRVEISPETQVEKTSAEVTVTAHTEEIDDGQTVTAKLLDERYQPVGNLEASSTVSGNQAEITLLIPDTVKPGTYYIQAEWEGESCLSGKYTVTSNRKAPVFPNFEPGGYTIEMADYQYNPTEEFNFPCVVDTKEHPVANELGNYRYYLFYAPHNAPAGNCVAASNSLNGPWVEYGSNPVVANVWPKNDGSGENYYKVSHVSSPHVIWNDVYDCWFMYFHGENNVTRYATSDDLIHWNYGGVCVVANDFSPTGSGLTEASYARVFEHEIPGLGNKYIMTIMVNNSAGMRKIYYAYSADGKEWTAVQHPLLTPEGNPEYKGNFSGAYFMEWEGRYFVICHASSGNMYAFEVGASLDEAIPWGVFYDSIDSTNPADAEDESAYPDYGRAGAPSFMRDDEGVWHMFYEGGRRLHANIVHARETDPSYEIAVQDPVGGSAAVTVTPDGPQKQGQEILIDIANLETGMTVKEISIAAGTGNVPVEEVTENVPEGTLRYRFAMPAGRVSVSVALTADKSALQALYNENRDKQNEGYTEDSWKAFTVALSAAETVLKDDSVLPEQVEKARSDLQKAVNGLVLKSSLDHLNDLIAACEALDESKFEEQSWANLQAKLSAAKAVAAGPEAVPEAINEAFDQLAKAKDDLVYHVDKEILRLSIELAQKTDITGCTSGSIAALNEALEAAQNVLNQADATQEEVNDAAKDLLNAIINLKDIMADKAELQKLADLAAGLTEAKYTPASWSTVKVALEAAQVLLPDDDATQEAVDGAYGTLAQAIAHLTLRAQTNSLNVAIELAQTIVSGLDQYAPATVEGLQEKLDAAKAVQGNLNATQEEVDAAAKALAEAAAKARLKANKKDLQQAYAQAQKLDAGKYTEGSVKRLSAALTTTAAVLENENATQQEVDQAKDVLSDAVQTLEVKPAGGTENSSSPNNNSSSGNGSSGNGSSSSLNNSNSSEDATGTVSTVPTGTGAENETDSPQTGEPFPTAVPIVSAAALAGACFLLIQRHRTVKMKKDT